MKNHSDELIFHSRKVLRHGGKFGRKKDPCTSSRHRGGQRISHIPSEGHGYALPFYLSQIRGGD